MEIHGAASCLGDPGWQTQLKKWRKTMGMEQWRAIQVTSGPDPSCTDREPGPSTGNGAMETKTYGISSNGEAFACPTVRGTWLWELFSSPISQDPCHFYLRTHAVCRQRGSLPRKMSVHHWKHWNNSKKLELAIFLTSYS